MRTGKGWDVTVGVAQRPRPLTSGLNFNEQKVPHGRKLLGAQWEGWFTQCISWGLEVQPGVTLDIQDNTIKCRYVQGVDKGCICVTELPVLLSYHLQAV